MTNVVAFPSERIRRVDPVIEQTVKRFMTVTVDKEILDELQHVIQQHARDVNKMWNFIDRNIKLNIKKHIRDNMRSSCYKYFEPLLYKEV